VTDRVQLHVASAGGHLAQLVALTERLRSPDDVPTLWVTYDVPQARSVLAGQRVVFAHHPTTKNVPNALRNYRLARRVLAEQEVTRVVSTGAAVAVPFIVRARQLGIPCHYIESATRVAGPSLTGRMLELVPGVHRYRQVGDWGGARWSDGPSVFDGFGVETRPASSGTSSVVVSLGTHGFPFTAMVESVRRSLASEWVDVLWQLGGTPPPPGLHGEVTGQLQSDRLDAAFRRADVVIGHAGTGLALTALRAGKVPVLVPRRRTRGEHTDDHQVQLARELDRRGLAVVAEVGELSREHVERAARLAVTHQQPPPFRLA
jgi:UDP-N-acetylglucosamine--N-acetylmuramyl-(pentapeptide) pyrophosphoryl-undecaprenol N-acetylglucosamine transferase